jgi:hypothetical protein
VVWRDPRGRRHGTNLPAISYGARRALTTPTPDDGPIWDWQVDAQGIAKLTMPSWVTYKGHWDWKGWLT